MKTQKLRRIRRFKVALFHVVATRPLSAGVKRVLNTIPRFVVWRGIALALLGMAYAVWALLAFPIPVAVANFFSGGDNSHSLIPEMVLIPAGSFTMGSPASEQGRQKNEGPQHIVQVAEFEMGKTEVTFEQWDMCVADGGCNHKPEDEGGGRGKRPVMNVSSDDITQQYIPWLNKKTGKGYRLPSEAEWEYAAREGCSTPFNVAGKCQERIEFSQANFDANDEYGSHTQGVAAKTKTVGSYSANGWGLYDMHGNVWEWVGDCWNDYTANLRTDARAIEIGNCRAEMLRGGGWNVKPKYLRSAYRNLALPNDRDHTYGFRLARTVP